MFGMNSKGAAAQINPEGLHQLNRGHIEEPIDYVLLQIKINTHYSYPLQWNWQVAFACQATPLYTLVYKMMAYIHSSKFFLPSRVLAYSYHSLPITSIKAFTASKRACNREEIFLAGEKVYTGSQLHLG